MSGARLLVAGTASGSGKTVVACGLMRAFARRGLSVRAGKCGPDYLDPRFHEQVVGVPSRNLDLFLDGRECVQELLAGMGAADITVIEGVMGYYDGIAESEEASSFDLARQTSTPAVLVVDGRGRGLSLAAEVAGYARFREPSAIGGVILNRVRPQRFARAKELVERETALPVLGHLPPLEAAYLESRHLGLVSATEVGDLSERIDAVADALEACCDLEALIELAEGAGPLPCAPHTPSPVTGSHPNIAVARDEAFQFYYPSGLELLERLGARLVSFSPLRDTGLPADCSGLYLGGGYPELHARELSGNEGMRRAIRRALEAGMPTIAECGGYLYLHEELEDDEGRAWPLVGALTGHARRGRGFGHFGYVTLRARERSLIADKGDEIRAHEFHYWTSVRPDASFRATKPDGSGWDGICATSSLYAGFPHLSLAGCPRVAERFVRACASWSAPWERG